MWSSMKRWETKTVNNGFTHILNTHALRFVIAFNRSIKNILSYFFTIESRFRTGIPWKYFCTNNVKRQISLNFKQTRMPFRYLISIIIYCVCLSFLIYDYCYNMCKMRASFCVTVFYIIKNLNISYINIIIKPHACVSIKIKRRLLFGKNTMQKKR